MKFLTDPCGPKGECLVKACCGLVRKSEWARKTHCPEYKIYHGKKEKIESWLYSITELSFIVGFIILFLWIILTLILGMIEEWHYIKRFITFMF